MALLWIVAAESPSIPAEITALGALVGIVYWLVKRADSSDRTRDDELAATRKELAEARREHTAELETIRRRHAEELAAVRAEIAEVHRDHAAEIEERRRQHAVELEQMRQAAEIYREERHRIVGHFAAARGALHMVRTAIDTCTCDSLALVAPLISEVLDAQEPPP